MKQVMTLVVLAAGVVAAGCAGVPREELAAAEFDPLPANWRDQVINVIGLDASDYHMPGYSPQYTFKEPYKAALWREGEGWAFGHAVRVHYDAPVRYGGYVAQQKRYFFFDRGRARRVHNSDRLVRVD